MRFTLIWVLAGCWHEEDCLEKADLVEPEPGADEICDPTQATPCGAGLECVQLTRDIMFAVESHADDPLYLCLEPCEVSRERQDCPTPGPSWYGADHCPSGGSPGRCSEGFCEPSIAYYYDDEEGWLVSDR